MIDDAYRAGWMVSLPFMVGVPLASVNANQEREERPSPRLTRSVMALVAATGAAPARTRDSMTWLIRHACLVLAEH
jgi:hypothetical protein